MRLWIRSEPGVRPHFRDDISGDTQRGWSAPDLSCRQHKQTGRISTVITLHFRSLQDITFIGCNLYFLHRSMYKFMMFLLRNCPLTPLTPSSGAEVDKPTHILLVKCYSATGRSVWIFAWVKVLECRLYSDNTSAVSNPPSEAPDSGRSSVPHKAKVQHEEAVGSSRVNKGERLLLSLFI